MKFANLLFKVYNIYMKNLIVTEKFNNKLVSEFLLFTFPALNKNSIFKAFRKKDIIINSKRTTTDLKVFAGDEIIIYITDAVLFNINIDIIYEDENIIIINKPVGLEVDGENSLTSLLQTKYNTTSTFPCHRLDKNTTGLVLFARNEITLSILLDKFKNSEINKYYIAKVYGIPKNDFATLTAFLFKDSKKSIVYVSDTKKPGYLPITTKYKTINCDKKNNSSTLEVELITGKTHQIRAHLAHIGHPIIGDR